MGVVAGKEKIDLVLQPNCFCSHQLRLQWRNRLAHGTYRQYKRNAGVVSSSLTWSNMIFLRRSQAQNFWADHDRTRTCNPQIRSLVPYPLGHMVLLVWQELYGWVDVGTFHAGLQPDENIWNLGNIVVSFYDMLEPVLDIVERNMCWHRWFSGRMLACHAGGPGSIPGRCIFFLLFFCKQANATWISLWSVSPFPNAKKNDLFPIFSIEGQCVANFLSPTDLPSIQSQITDHWEPRVGAGDVMICAVFWLARIGSPDMTAVQASICRIT